MPLVIIEGRAVHHRIGRKTQTVSICTTANQRGVYEDRYSHSMSVEGVQEELAAQVSLACLREWLAHHGWQPLTTHGRPGDGLPPLLAAPSAEDPWVVAARAAVDRVLETVVVSFREQPYLHRVEHSLHAWIWSLLVQEPALHGEVPLKDGKTLTQLVHKEWPETIPRTKLDGTLRPRGLFDLAVLSPDQLREADVEQFVFGRIEAPIVIEVGLDYGLKHLDDDAKKLANSKVRLPYLLHLSRLNDKHRPATERLLCDAAPGVSTAYVHVHPRTGVRWKAVHDTEVSQAALGVDQAAAMPLPSQATRRSSPSGSRPDAALATVTASPPAPPQPRR